MLSHAGQGGLASVLDVQSLFILLKKIGTALCPEIMLIIYFWQKNLSFDSDVRQWSHPLMIPLHCLWDKLNNRTCGHFEYDVALFFYYYYYYFVHSLARCSCSIVCLLFQVMQIKQVDCKMSTKKNFFEENISWYFWTTAHTRM